MEKNIRNYLSNLPSKKNLNKVSDKNFYKKLINQIITSPDDIDDYNLINFKHQVIYLFISKLLDENNNFNSDNYFLTKNNLTILDELLIKSSTKELITLLNESDDKLIEYINNLNKVHDFNCSYERIEVKEDNKKKIKRVKKDAIPEDIYLYINELSKEVYQYLVNTILNAIDPDDYLNSIDTLEQIIFEDEDIRNKIYTNLQDNFRYLDNDNILIIKQIIDNYMTNYLIIIKKIISGRRIYKQSTAFYKKRTLENSLDFAEKKRSAPYGYYKVGKK